VRGLEARALCMLARTVPDCSHFVCTAGVNKRCEGDPQQQARINQMLNMSLPQPITRQMLSQFQTLDTSLPGAELPPALLKATLMVGDNVMRTSFNRSRAVIFGVSHGLPVIGWRLPVQRALRTELSESNLDRLYERAPEITAFFVKDAPAMQLENRNTAMRLSNGQMGVFHSLTLDEPSRVYLASRLSDAAPGDVIMLQCMPAFVNVTFRIPAREFATKWTDAQYLCAAAVVDSDMIDVTVSFPPVVNSHACTEVIKSLKVGKGKTAVRFHYSKPYVDLAFAVTFWKAQGVTLNNVLIDFSSKQRNFTLAVAYVVLTRVRDSRCMWLLSGHLDRLTNLQRNKFLHLWHRSLVLTDAANNIFRFDPSVCEKFRQVYDPDARPKVSQSARDQLTGTGTASSAATPTASRRAVATSATSVATQPRVQGAPALVPAALLPSAPCGLRNLYNSCFANSASQLLLCCLADLQLDIAAPLAVSVCGEPWRSRAATFAALQSATSERSALVGISWREFMWHGCGYAAFERRGAAAAQADAAAFCQALIDCLCLGLSTSLPVLPRDKLPALTYDQRAIDSGMIDSDDAAVMTGLHHRYADLLERQKLVTQQQRWSVFEQLVTGWHRKVIRCTNCNACAVSFESFNVLQLPVPTAHAEFPTLQRAFDFYSPPELLADYRCPVCDVPDAAQTHVDLHELPKLLVIELRRYRFVHAARTDKIDTAVIAPADLTLRTFPDCVFKLVGAVQHIGGAPTEGHYTAHVQRDGRWYCCDDNVVTPSATAAAIEVASTSYLLAYVRQDV
jgi:ubiquitin C-terminal hydrolase